MKNIQLSSFLCAAKHFTFILLLFITTVLVRYPIFNNMDHFFTADDGLMANTILTLLDGGPLVFYYDFARYLGITNGLASIPFIWFLGVKPLAFNVTGALFYSLYAWTTYLISKILTPRMAPLVLALMLITPPYITEMTTHNWGHVPAAFLGNLIFLLFIKVKTSKEISVIVIFLLFFSMGLAIYTYTFSLIYISVIVFLYALYHPRWNNFREKISFSTLAGLFRKQDSKAKKISRALDVLCFFFIFAIVFSYIFGGFAIDIGNVSIFQIKNFHKPVIQLIGIVLLRITVYRKDLIHLSGKIKQLFMSKKIPTRAKYLFCVGATGFFLGLLPRIISILTGETSRGGQGFDVDLLPTELASHFWDMISRSAPILFGLDGFWNLATDFNLSYAIILWALLFALVTLFASTGFYFFFYNWIIVKKIFSLKAITFEAHHIFILLPILVCMANIVVENGSLARYLFPLFGTCVLWIGWFLSKVQEKVKWLPILVLVVWVGVYSLKNYQMYKDSGLINGFTLIKLKKLELYDLLSFLESNEINVAYSNYHVSAVGTFLSKGKINISEYTDNPIATTQKARSMSNNNFALIAQGNRATIYSDFLIKNNTSFKLREIGIHKVFWDFSGDATNINKLRSFFHR